MTRKNTILILIFCCSLLLSGCDVLMGGTGDTAGVGTITPAPTQTDLPPSPTGEPSTATLIPTRTPEPSVTPIPTLTFTPEPTKQPLTIVGRVWRDECVSSGSEIEPQAGCVENPNGAGYIANGVFDPTETGLEDVAVVLFEGACPATTLIETIFTNPDGFYAIQYLAPGTYCVQVDPLSEHNMALQPPMLPGVFSAPGVGVGEITLTSEYGGNITDVDFGWDYNVEMKDCKDAAVLVDENVADNNGELKAGETFTKTWALENTGTCTWTTDYAISHTSGTLMSAAAAYLLEEEVVPGEIAEITLEMVAPMEAGVYEADWLMRGNGYLTFGLGNTDNPLTVKIKVNPELMYQEAGAPFWEDTFATSKNWNGFEDETGKMEITDGRLAITAYGPSAYDIWTTTYPQGYDFFLESVITTGNTCTKNDRYGIVFRMSSEEGYLFGVTCDGKYSIRRWMDQSFSFVVGWAESPYIKTGPNVTNHLGIMALDEQLGLYINGTLIDTVEDTQIAGGKFGPFLAANTSDLFTVYFDEIAYWSLTE